jgi:DivIVA domain-containing protein
VRERIGECVSETTWHDRGVEWFIAVIVVAALGVAAVVAAGGLGSMAAEPTRDVFRQDLPGDRVLTGDDLQRLRFGVALRGYSMTQVDDVLDRLSGELALRDERIAELEARLGEQSASTMAAPISTGPTASTPSPSTSNLTRATDAVADLRP